MQKKDANGQVIFSHFLPFLTFLFSPFILLPFFSVLKFWFSMCFPFFCIFSNLKIIRISYWGEHKDKPNFHKLPVEFSPSCVEPKHILSNSFLLTEIENTHRSIASFSIPQNGKHLSRAAKTTQMLKLWLPLNLMSQALNLRLKQRL